MRGLLIIAGVVSIALAAWLVAATINPAWDELLITTFGIERRPVTRVPFPEIRDWSSLRMSLERTPCFGSCPAYKVTVSGDGTVAYDGVAFVVFRGRASATVPPEQVRELFEAFRKAEFFWLYESYAAEVTDNPMQIVSLSFDGRIKIVRDYVGHLVGMPIAAKQLECAIDRIAGVERWTNDKASRVPTDPQCRGAKSR